MNYKPKCNIQHCKTSRRKHKINKFSVNFKWARNFPGHKKHKLLYKKNVDKLNITKNFFKGLNFKRHY